MVKLYVVTSGDYSDYGIDAIFSTKELAQKFIDSFEKATYHRFNEIEIRTLNPFEKELREGFRPYFIYMDKDGNASDIHIEDSPYGFGEPYEIGSTMNGKMYIHCYAKDEQHAIKICNEQRVQLIESGKWEKKIKIRNHGVSL